MNSIQHRLNLWLFISIVWVLVLAPAEAAVRHVIQISVDGLRGDKLKELVDASPESFPGFVRLQNEGAFTYNARCDYDFSVTVPNHASMVTGRPVAHPEGQPDTTHHGFNTNFPQPTSTLHNFGNTNLSYICSVFDVAHDHGLTTAYYVGKTRLEYIDRSYNEVIGAPDLTGEDNGTDKIDVSIVQDGNTQVLIDAITNDLAQAAMGFTFVHITDPDGAGHASGWISMAWDAAVLDTDGWIVQILDAIDANPALAGQVALTLTGDHGGGGGILNNHTDATLPENYVIPFFVWGAGVTPGADLYTQFLNRVDPGTDRPDYNGEQPIRDGDAGNLSLALLGLPPIPGSFILPEISFGEIKLAFNRTANALNLSWPAFPSDLILECATHLNEGNWRKITNAIFGDTVTRTYDAALEDGPSSFYRLRTPAFKITEQPESVAVHSGADVTFTVSTDTAGLKFQWQFDGVNLFGATDPSLTLSAVQVFHQGSYTVVVSDDVDSIASAPAMLALILNPVISQHPESLTVNTGDDVILTVSAIGAGELAYQWRHNGIDLPGATSDTLFVAAVQAADEGPYTVVVSDAIGSTISEPGVLSVFLIPVIVQDPMAQTVNVGDTVSFTVVVTGNPPPFGYRWRRNNLTVFSDSSDERTSTFTITDVQMSHAGRYDVVVTNPAFSSPGVPSQRALLTVVEP